jgi:ATP-binding cassette subfamily B protein
MATPGEIAATGAIAMRIAQMTGWVSFTLMAIYANVGEVEDGMRTLTPPHTLTDAPTRHAAPDQGAHRRSRT